MTSGFIASFGGLFIVMLLFAAFEYVVSRGRSRLPGQSRAPTDVTAALERAETAARELQEEIAQLRMSIG